ncbi:UTRA domain-containing protein [Oryzomonas rubra]|uniref:UTRA domain-containing protein n=1 Tax=Oryzomonas rubra TaxID=2509454 RepID=A0A5A9X564_9BACT|nr:UTRA domain-containing protein [Oryzomonas rubra]
MTEELQTTVGSPVLKITRNYRDHGGSVFQISITIHPADRFTFSTRLTKEKK